MFLKKLVWPVMAFVLFVPNLLEVHLTPLPVNKSAFDVAYDSAYVARIRSENDLERIIDSVELARNVKSNSLEYAELIDSLVLRRFYFGYSYYSLKENWMAAVAGRLFWRDLAAIVIPDDILHYPMAACSQQCIVLMDAFRRKQIPYRVVGFDHHYALEARVGGKWYFFDPTFDPVFPNGRRTSFAEVLRTNEVRELYFTRFNSNAIYNTLAHPTYSEANMLPAPRARVFHLITRLLSHWLWVVPLLVWAALYFKKRF